MNTKKNQQPVETLSARDRRQLRIIDKAHRVFKAKGYEQSSLKEIADVAEITVPTLYNHFGSKQQLLAAVVNLLLDEVRTRLEEQGFPSSADAGDFLVEHQLQVQLILIEVLSPQVWTDAHMYYYLNPEQALEARQMDAFFIRIAQQSLEEMQSRKLIRPGLELTPLANLVDLASYYVAHQIIPTGNISTDALREGLDYLLRPLVQLMESK